MALLSVNLQAYETGENYLSRLNQESERNFKLFLALLSSYWQSSIDGPNYAREIKAMAIEISRIRLALEEVLQDTYYQTTRTEFLYQTLTSIIFPGKEGAPDLQESDTDFRVFLNELISIYYAGSVPESIRKALELVISGTIEVRENFLEARKSGSGLDISDQFTFDIDVLIQSPGDLNVFLADKNTRIVLNIIRPAHTLYRLRFILKDAYVGNYNASTHQFSKVLDAFKADISNYNYEDFRRFAEGVEGIDNLGMKKSVSVTGENHDSDF